MAEATNKDESIIPDLLKIQNVSCNKEYGHQKYDFEGSGPNYKGGGIRTSLHGVTYQVNLLTLFLIRGLKEKYIFSLATEVDAAEKFDDLVFKYEKCKGDTSLRFLQAKHKQDYSRKVTEADIIDETGGDFSVQKYFISYMNIKKHTLFKGEYQDFIICTNIDIDSNLESSFFSVSDKDPLLGFDEFKCSNSPKILKLVKGTSLYKNLSNILQKNPDYPQIVHKIGVMAAKSNTILIEEKFTYNRNWILKNIFDYDTKKYKGSKCCLLLRKDFLFPETENMANLCTVFLNAYMEKNHTDNETNTYQNYDEVTRENVKGRLSKTEFELGRSFVNGKGKDRSPPLTQFDIDLFLNKLVFAVNQPTEVELKNIIEEEAAKYMNLLNGELVASKLQMCILDWVKKRHGRFVTSQDCLELFTDVEDQLASWGQLGFTITHKTQHDKYNCFFEITNNRKMKKYIRFLNQESDDQILIVYYDCRVLTETKLIQLKENSTPDEYIFSNMDIFLDQQNTKVCPVRAFKSRSCNQIFLTISENVDLNDKVIILLSRLFNILSDRPEKRIVLLVPLNIRDQFENISEDLLSNYNCVEEKDTGIKFTDLSLSCQDNLLKEAKMKFRGCLFNINAIIDKDMMHKFSGEILFKLIRREFELQVDDCDNRYNEVKEFCLDRSFQRCIVISNSIQTDEKFVITTNSQDIITLMEGQEVLLVTDDKTDFEILLHKYYRKNVHWLEMRLGELIWRKTSGSINKLQEYVCHARQKDFINGLYSEFVCDADDDTLSFDADSEIDEEITNKNIEKMHISNTGVIIKRVTDIPARIVIISAEPGMGKSTMLSHIAAQSKIQENDQSKKKWVIKTNLRDYCDDFAAARDAQSKQITIEEAIQFIYKASKLDKRDNRTDCRIKTNINVLSDGSLITNSVPDDPVDLLKIRLFIYLYNQGKIVLLLDGFDEIAPSFVDQVLGLLEVLKNTRLHKLWITTRPYNIKNKLENQLNTFSYTLVPFKTTEQIQFIKKLWEQKLKIEIASVSLERFLKEKLPRTFWYYNVANNKTFYKSVFLGIPQHVLMLATIYENHFRSYYENLHHPEKNILPENKQLTIHDLYSKFFRIKFQSMFHNINLNDPLFESDYERKFQLEIIKHRKLAMWELFEENELLLNELMEETQPDYKKKLLESVSIGNLKIGLVERLDENGLPRFLHRTYAEYFASEVLAEILISKAHNAHRYEIAKDFLYNLLSDIEQSNNMFTFLNYKIISMSEHYEIFDAAISFNIELLKTVDKLEDIRDCFGRSPIHLACYGGKAIFHERLEGIFDIRADKYYVHDDLFKWTPFHYAVVAYDGSLLNFPKEDRNSKKINYKSTQLQDCYGATPCILAAKRGLSYNHIKDLFRELPLNINAQDNYGMTALHYALAKPSKSPSFIVAMIEDEADIFISDNQGKSPFDIIFSINDSDFIGAVINRLFKENDPHFVDLFTQKSSSNKDLCIYLLSFPDMRLIHFLLQKMDLDINMQDSAGRTALHHAFQRLVYDFFGQVSTVSLMFLLEQNADINLRDNNGRLPSYIDYVLLQKLHRAPLIFKTLDYLTAKNPKVMKPFIMSLEPDDYTTVCIMSAFRFIADVFLDGKTTIDMKDSKLKTALHYAVLFKRLYNVQHLLMKGASVISKDIEGKTPIECVTPDINFDEFYQTTEIIKSLVFYGAYFDVENQPLLKNNELIKSITILFKAVEKGDLSGIKYILSTSRENAKIIVNARSKTGGLTPFQIATSRGQKEIVDILSSYGAVEDKYTRN